MKRIAVPLIAIFAGASIITGVLSGFNRLGWFSLDTGVGGEHGALMVGSFLGTVILLERVVTAKNKLLFLLPLINGLSLPFFFLGFQNFAFISLTIGALGMCYVYLDILSRVKELSFYIMLGGAVCWLVGNLLVLFYGLYPMALPWWVSFLLLTIVGERLELTKFLPVKQKQKNILISMLLLTVVALGFMFHGYGQLLAGLMILGIVIWLLRFDMVRKNVLKEGLHRYSAVMLGIGYLWLGAYGIFLVLGNVFDISYDTLVHTFFIGFVINMIFAHAPIILPGVAKLKFYPYHPALYVSGILLQLSLISRVVGNVFILAELKYYGGLLNGIFIFTFLLSMMIIVVSKVLTTKSKVKTQKAVLN